MNWDKEKIKLPLDIGRKQRQLIDWNGKPYVEGECGKCGSYGDPENDQHRLKSSKFGYYFGQNLCHKCWVQAPVLGSQICS